MWCIESAVDIFLFLFESLRWKVFSGSGGDTTTTSTVGMPPVEWPQMGWFFCVSKNQWVFPKIGGKHQNGWWKLWKLLLKLMIWGENPTIFGNIHISLSNKSASSSLQKIAWKMLAVHWGFGSRLGHHEPNSGKRTFFVCFFGWVSGKKIIHIVILNTISKHNMVFFGSSFKTRWPNWVHPTLLDLGHLRLSDTFVSEVVPGRCETQDMTEVTEVTSEMERI